jgi:hypothetical protein
MRSTRNFFMFSPRCASASVSQRTLCQKRLEQNVNERHRVRSGTFFWALNFLLKYVQFFSALQLITKPLDGGAVLRKVLMGRFAYYLVI